MTQSHETTLSKSSEQKGWLRHHKAVAAVGALAAIGLGMFAGHEAWPKQQLGFVVETSTDGSRESFSITDTSHTIGAVVDGDGPNRTNVLLSGTVDCQKYDKNMDSAVEVAAPYNEDPAKINQFKEAMGEVCNGFTPMEDAVPTIAKVSMDLGLMNGYLVR